MYTLTLSALIVYESKLYLNLKKIRCSVQRLSVTLRIFTVLLQPLCITSSVLGHFTTMNSPYLRICESLGFTLKEKSLKIVTAESCTGGGVSSAITSVSGASNWFEQGYVAYADTAKVAQLNVSQETLNKQGSVSEPVVIEMLKGALLASNADIGIAISGIAGPEGGTTHKPVGTVCIAWGTPDDLHVNTYLFTGNREQIREAAIKQSLHLALRLARSI